MTDGLCIQRCEPLQALVRRRPRLDLVT